MDLWLVPQFTRVYYSIHQCWGHIYLHRYCMHPVSVQLFASRFITWMRLPANNHGPCTDVCFSMPVWMGSKKNLFLGLHCRFHCFSCSLLSLFIGLSTCIISIHWAGSHPAIGNAKVENGRVLVLISRDCMGKLTKKGLAFIVYFFLF